MNLLYVLNTGNPGGLEQYTLDLVKGMIQKGNVVHVWCKDGPIVSWFKDVGATVTVKPINFDIDPAYILSLYSYIKENKIDLVHTGELKAGVNGLLAAVIARKKVITHTHTPISEWPVTGTFKKIFTQIEIVVYSTLVNLFSSYELALTNSRKEIKMKEGMSSDKLMVIPNGFDFSRLDISADEKRKYKMELFEQYNLPQDAIILGNISRLTEEKGHVYALEAFSLLLADKSIDTSKLYLFFGGGGKLESSLKVLAEKLNISHRVRISGVFPVNEWTKYYSIFDLCVFATVAEGFGLALIEGMYLGVPIICSDLPVLKEVGEGTVKYFKTADSKDLYNKLKEIIIEHKDTWNAIDTPAKLRVSREFGIDKFVNTYLDLYKKVLENK